MESEPLIDVRGEVVEVGKIEDQSELGIVIDVVPGGQLTLVGLSREQVKKIASCYGEKIRLQIS